MTNDKIVMRKLFAIVAVATVATLIESAVLAVIKHHSIASERSADERLNRSNLYQLDAQGNRPYPNPDHNWAGMCASVGARSAALALNPRSPRS
jgi:hypothetical protein